MSLDLSDAITLAKDLLKTSDDFLAHDPDLAVQFSDRAFEICDDLGIDRALIGDQSLPDLIEDPLEDDQSAPEADPTPVETSDLPNEETQQASDQLRDLLRQQARVLQNVHETENTPEPKAKKRSFRLFGRSVDEDMGALQSA